MAVQNGVRWEEEKRVDAFYTPAKVGGASDFGLGITGLGITNVKAVGHRFRGISGDPAAKEVDRDRGLTNGDGGSNANGGSQTIPERVMRTPNFLPAVFLDLGWQRARCVCKIDTSGVDFQKVTGIWFGTGFLVAPDILLTNHHVLNSIDVARSAWCIFNYQLGADNKPLEVVAVRLEPDRLFLTSPLTDGLDYTFVGIDKKAGEHFGFIPIQRSAFTIHPGDNANIVQHPEGGYKKVTIQENEVLQDTGVVIHYASDTLGGSSGAPVFNNRWELIALHHASKKADGLTLPDRATPPDYVNEGIKISAIAADLEARVEAGGGVSASRSVLKIFGGVDSLMGFFGALGRHPEAVAAPQAPQGPQTPQVPRAAGAGIDRVLDTYSSEGQDVDIAFWNVEWFTPCFRDKADALAEAMVDLNCDIWALGATTSQAAAALVAALHKGYDLDFGCTCDEPKASGGLQTAVLWNMATVVCELTPWPSGIDDWFRVDSQQFADLRGQASQGPVFDCHPGLLVCRSANRSGLADPFQFHLVPVQLRSSRERSARTRMASRILAAAVRQIAQDDRSDWIFGGDFAGDVATQEFRAIVPNGLVALSAAEADAGAVTYLRSSTSLIDHIFLSSNLGRTFGADDFFIVPERSVPDYIRNLGNRTPLLVRLSLADRLPQAAGLPASLVNALGLT